MRFFLFILCFFSSFFFAFLVWKFDALFVGLLVVAVVVFMVTVNRRGR